MLVLFKRLHMSHRFAQVCSKRLLCTGQAFGDLGASAAALVELM